MATERDPEKDGRLAAEGVECRDPGAGAAARTLHDEGPRTEGLDAGEEDAPVVGVLAGVGTHAFPEGGGPGTAGAAVRSMVVAEPTRSEWGPPAPAGIAESGTGPGAAAHVRSRPAIWR